MNDLLGRALLDYQDGNYSEDVRTFSSLDEEDVLPLPYLFRSYGEMPPLEREALQLCRGSILDIGCGAGNHSLFLQEKGYEVIALDHSKGAIETCRLRGVKNCIHSTIFDVHGRKFDTLLLLMNGVGIVGQLGRLKAFFKHLKSLLKPEGHILLDSSDIIYMYEKDDDGGRWVPDTGTYYGEVEFTLRYKEHTSEPFHWLYLDYQTLKQYASDCGLRCELVRNGEHYDYLVRLWH